MTKDLGAAKKSAAKKLIEVALPLDAINGASTREKSIRHGHPSTLHLWWARRPLATARAVLFASLVDDPSAYCATLEEAEVERARLFGVMEDLVQWGPPAEMAKASARAQREIARTLLRECGESLSDEMSDADVSAYVAAHAPAVRDPFAGGGAIPLEAVRLGLETRASDLNPVPVMLNIAMLDLPRRFAEHFPVNPPSRAGIVTGAAFVGARGLSEDVLYYGTRVKERAWEKIGHLYPAAVAGATAALGTTAAETADGVAASGTRMPVIAWIWARTIRCPNPACGVAMPLMRSFVLSRRSGSQAWIEPSVVEDGPERRMAYRVVESAPDKARGATVDRRGATCVGCGTSVKLDHVRAEGQAGRIGADLIAVVAEGPHGRVYLSPTADQREAADTARPEWAPTTALPEQALGFRVQNYGIRTHAQLFTPRQLTAMTTFCDVAREVRGEILRDALAAGLSDDGAPLRSGGTGARAYAEAVSTYLALVVDRLADRLSANASWDVSRDNIRNTFARQAIPMVWDFAEANPFSDSSGNWLGAVRWVAKVVEQLPIGHAVTVAQQDAAAPETPALSSAEQTPGDPAARRPLFSTDPPYYDNVSYADLSDYFYVWLRAGLKDVYPELFATLLTPKAEELVATPFRFGGDQDAAKRYFETGLQKTFFRMREQCDARYPVTVYYAYKQSDSEEADDDGADGTTASTGWETMLSGLIEAGFQVTGTWPVRTELSNRTRGLASNALASSIVLVCRVRPDDAPVTTRRDLLHTLRRELPDALRDLQRTHIAPVDMEQAAIGPAMSIFSRYKAVLEPNGETMTVRAALGVINQLLREVLAQDSAEYDDESRWALTWYRQVGLGEGPYGIAETNFKAKNTSLTHIERHGIALARAGKVRLRARDEVLADDRAQCRSVWMLAQRLAWELPGRGEAEAARTLWQGRALADAARDLTYQLYHIASDKGWTDEAIAYNGLILAWTRLADLAGKLARETGEGQARLDL